MLAKEFRKGEIKGYVLRKTDSDEERTRRDYRKV